MAGNINVPASDCTRQKCSTKNNTRLCFYHVWYGTDATRCTQNNCPMVAGATNSRLLHIQDRSSGCSFLIDTGAEVSLVPASPADHCAFVSSTHFAPLVAANRKEIKTYGTHRLPLNLGNKCLQGLSSLLT